MQSFTHQARRLRKHTERLTIDALAVLTGLRPAAMLDYAPSCRPEALAQMCGCINAANGAGCGQAGVDGPCITALTWQGVLWLVNCEVLERRVRRVLSERDAAVPELCLVLFCEAQDAGPVQLVPAQRHAVRARLNSVAVLPVCLHVTWLMAHRQILNAPD